MSEEAKTVEKKVVFGSSMYPSLQDEFKKVCAMNGEAITDVLDRLVRGYVENNRKKGVDE